MKFIIDAQLPFGLKKILIELGQDAIHTDDLSTKEKTTDNQIREISEKENRIVITKDSDFVDSFYIKKVPKRLLFVSTGNIVNKKLFELFQKNFPTILELFEIYDFIEMNNYEIISND